MHVFDMMNVGWRILLWPEVALHPDYPFKDELPHNFRQDDHFLLSEWTSSQNVFFFNNFLNCIRMRSDPVPSHLIGNSPQDAFQPE
jgi:hypothetical protein